MVTLIKSDEKEEKLKLMFANTRGTLSAVRRFLIELRAVSLVVPERERDHCKKKSRRF